MTNQIFEVALENVAVLINIAGLCCDIYGAYKLFHLKIKPLSGIRPSLQRHKIQDTAPNRVSLLELKKTADAVYKELTQFIYAINQEIDRTNKENEQTHKGSKVWLYWLMAGFALQLLSSVLQFWIVPKIEPLPINL